ncbi:DUF1269 domain-containing protein [Bdellovibrio sp. HCB337]|uniref:DUF1269 domain-containing protein n=1 Tax=Bdellovibrio sp. HCB337 TaxID=3394358 RepID=UPI0039A42011
MSVLIAILYPEEKVADEVLEAVEKLSHDGHLDIEDACAVVKDIHGKVKLHQENDLSLFGAVAGLALGTFFGWFIWLPYLGVPGAIIGALAGRASDRGINDHYMRDLGKEMQPRTSALFVLLRSTSAEGALQELAPYGGRIFHTSLTKSEELNLEEKLEQLRQQKKPETSRPPELRE